MLYVNLFINPGKLVLLINIPLEKPHPFPESVGYLEKGKDFFLV